MLKKLMGLIVAVMLFVPALAFAHTMPLSEMSIAGITFGETLGGAKAKLGTPGEVTSFKGDGVLVVSLIYPRGLEVTAREGMDYGGTQDNMKVCGVTAQDPFFKSPAGLCVGMKYSDVVKKFGEGGKSEFYEDCYFYELPGREMNFRLDKSGTIVEMSIAAEM